jgi:hypothetical protein
MSVNIECEERRGKQKKGKKEAGMMQMKMYQEEVSV